MWCAKSVNGYNYLFLSSCFYYELYLPLRLSIMGAVVNRRLRLCFALLAGEAIAEVLLDVMYEIFRCQCKAALSHIV